MKQTIPWVTSAVTLYAMWAIGQRRWWGWAVGLGNQVMWVALAVAFRTWGLLPLTGALIVVYTRNLLRWKRERVVVLGEA